ncbi:hypothetical protein CCHR01_15414 [Colletotrichum chrysophilum]|uniref:Uncharacterized protein n=1 Tax=Colletotrichum chrysophilum TaxID=1836956 RepID=A0AAD9A7Q7_9PEZI|nr:hypothetical protein CCHR01_15414 [Colletotrichum chrysophilum]
MSLFRRMPVPRNERPPDFQLLARQDDPDEKDDDCDDDDDEKKCSTRTHRQSTSSSTSSATQPSETPTNPQISSSIIPAPTSTQQAPPPTLSQATPSTVPVAAEPSSAPQTPPTSTAPVVVIPTTSLETSVIPLPTGQSSAPAAPTSSAAAAPATSTAPPPTQEANSNNAGRTAGIVVLILAFFAFFAGIFFLRRWRARRKRRTAEKAKSVMGPAGPPTTPPSPPPRTTRDLPPLTSHPPMTSLPPPPPIQGSSQTPAQSSNTASSSMYSNTGVVGKRPARNTRAISQVPLSQSAQVTHTEEVPRDEKPQAAFGIPTFLQSAINRRARNAELARARVETWPPPPYIGTKQPRAKSLKGLMTRSKPVTSVSESLSPTSFPGQRTYSSTSRESLILPWRSSIESDISSLSSGWGDGPAIQTPVLVNERPTVDRKVWISPARGSEVAHIREVPRDVV